MKFFRLARIEISVHGNSLLTAIREMLQWHGPRLPPLRMA